MAKNPFFVFLKNLLLLILVFSILGFMALYADSYVEGVLKNYEIEDILSSYIDKISSGEIDSQTEALQSFFSLSDDEIASLTSQEQTVLATSLASHLVVYDVSFASYSSLEGEIECLYPLSFTYDDVFSSFTLNPKWEYFYFPNGFPTFSLFSSVDYQYTYLSNVYMSGNDEFRLNYYEDDKKTVTYTDSWLDVNSFVVFDDFVQIVLPDLDSDGVADDVSLVFEVVISDITKDGESLNSQLFKIPVDVVDGVLVVRSPYVCSSSNIDFIKKVVE